MKEMNELIKEFNNIGLQSTFIEDASMENFTSFKVGGKADLLVIPSSEEELKIILQQLAQDKLPFIVMGKGTNLLIRDGGYRGVIIRLEDAFAEI